MEGWVWHVARMRRTRNSYNILFRKPEGKRLLGTVKWAYMGLLLKQILEN
jgi:hypothetical protein